MSSESLSTDVIRARNLLARLVKNQPDDVKAIKAARGLLATAHIARTIERHADALDADSRTSLAALLGPQSPADPSRSISGRRATTGPERAA